MKEPVRMPLEAAEPDLAGPRLVHETGGNDKRAVPSFCDELREARQRGGYSVADAAHVLRIQEHYLEALELGRFDQIPGTTYTIGFLRSYSGFLGLDPDEMVEAFKREQGLDRNEHRLSFPSPSDSSPKPKFWLILLVLVLAGLAYGGWQYQSTGGQIATDLVDDVSTRLTEAVGLNEGDVVAGGATGEGAAPETAAATTATQGAVVANEETKAETAAAPAEEPVAETATAPIVADVSTPAEPEPASGSPEQAEPVPAPAAPRQEEPAPAATADVVSAPTDDAEQGLIPAAEVWDEAGPEGAKDVAALEAPQAGGAPVDAPAASVEAASDIADAPAETAQPADVAVEAPPSEPQVAEVEISDPSPEIASPLDFAVAEVGGTSSSTSTTSSADDAGAAAVSEPSGSTDTAAAAVTDTATTESGSAETASTDPADSAAVDEVAPVPAAPEPTVDAAPGETVAASSSAATEEPTLPVVEADYVPKVYGRTNLDARVVITAVDDSWVQIMGPDNELLLTRIMHAGDSYWVPDRPGLVMVTGNAGGLEVRVDDAVAPTLGPLGVVMRNIALDPDRLLAGTATSG